MQHVRWGPWPSQVTIGHHWLHRGISTSPYLILTQLSFTRSPAFWVQSFKNLVYKLCSILASVSHVSQHQCIDISQAEASPQWVIRSDITTAFLGQILRRLTITTSDPRWDEATQNKIELRYKDRTAPQEKRHKPSRLPFSRFRIVCWKYSRKCVAKIVVCNAQNLQWFFRS